MGFTGVDLQVLASRAGITLKQHGTGRAGDDLAGAWFNLRTAAMGRSIVERLDAQGPLDALLTEVFHQPREVFWMAAMSLGFEDVMTALDLCADAVLLLGGWQPLDNGSYYDLRHLKRQRRKLTVPPQVQTWVDQLLAPHDDLTLLAECRHALAHRNPRLHPLVRWEDGRAVMALPELTTLHGRDPQRGTPIARWRGSIGDLVPGLVGFGEEQLEALCLATLQTWGG